jgi:NodT family efflux transporter outer membrane factor (OMF) lipoprotein
MKGIVDERRIGSSFFFATIVLMLTGCAVGPNFSSPAPPDVTSYLPARSPGLAGGDNVPGFTLVRGADIPAEWWAVFRSAKLHRLIRDGIEHNSDLRAAEAAVRVAQANTLAQRGALFPVFSANFQSSGHQDPLATLSPATASGVSIYSLSTPQVSVSFVPDVFGGTRRQIESVDALLEMQVFQREGVYLTLTANIALAAIQEASLRDQITATRQLIDSATKVLETLRRQNEQGQIALIDVLSQETAVAQARLQLPPLEKQLGQQLDLLVFLTGHLPSDDIAAGFQLGEFHLPTRLPLSLPASLVWQRPDIRAAEANLRSTNAQIGVAIANRLPQITLTGNAGSTALELAKLFSPGTGFWMLAGNVAQTVFDAGTLKNKQRAAEAATEQAAAQYYKVVQTAFQNVADTLRALQADSEAVSAAITAEQSAARNMELVRKQVEQGQVSVPILLTAQQAFLQTSIARINAEAARLADTVALFQALGGGLWNRPGSPAPQEQQVK